MGFARLPKALTVPWTSAGIRAMKATLNIAGSILGFAAAIAWFFAAWKAPQPGEPGAAFWDVVPSPNTPFAKAWRTATRLNQLAAVLTGLSVLLLSVAALAQDTAVQRAKLIEIIAFANLGTEPCASALDDPAWNAEVLKLLFGLKPPLTDAEITAEKRDVLEYRSRLGEAKWCELYAVKMHEAHLIFSLTNSK
jgi:hypothetical protein